MTVTLEVAEQLTRRKFFATEIRRRVSNVSQKSFEEFFMTNILIAGALAAGGHFKSGGTISAPKVFRNRNSSPRVKRFTKII